MGYLYFNEQYYEHCENNYLNIFLIERLKKCKHVFKRYGINTNRMNALLLSLSSNSCQS